LADLKLLHGGDGDLRGAQQQAAGLVPIHHADLLSHGAVDNLATEVHTAVH